MKINIFLFLVYILIASLPCFSQGSWTQKASYPLTARYYGNGFSIADKGYFIFGASNGVPNTVDLVEYDPSTNAWIQKANFPGGQRPQTHTFVIHNIVYIVSGVYWTGAPLDYTAYNDVWKYDPATNIWTPLNNFPGTGRHAGFAFECCGKGYFGIGFDENNNFLYDFWEYNPLTDTWTQKSNYPGPGRKSGFQFSLGEYGYVGMGIMSGTTQLNDVWQYNPSQDSWTQKNNFPASGLTWESYFTMNGRGYVVTGRKVNLGINSQEVWEYDPDQDTWTSMQTFPGAARYAAAGFSINGKGYTGIGYSTTYQNDFWEFTPSITGWYLPDEKQIEEVKIYPNPSNTDVNISIVKPRNKDISLAIYDASGKCVKRVDLERTSQLITVEHSLFSVGVYYFVTGFGNKTIVKKLIIK